MKLNTSLPVKKKAKSERGTIMSFFNSKKMDQTDEHKENNTRRRSDSTNKVNTMTTRRSKKQEEEKQQQPVPTDPSLLSSVHVEKSSLILFDEVCQS